jgi:hypothetical protein
VTRSKKSRRAKVPPAVQVRIVSRGTRKISPALPAAVPRVRVKKGKPETPDEIADRPW